jgi:hypothetical protein
MYITFEQMPANARVWVYQANKNLSEEETSLIEQDLITFVEKWTAHQQTLKASAKVFFNRFLVLSVDESLNGVSGCSIDASVHFLQELENRFSIQLFDRLKLAYWDGNDIKTDSLKSLKQKITDGVLQENTLIFNNLVSIKQDFETQWQQPAIASWLFR